METSAKPRARGAPAASALTAEFEHFRAELDEHHDRRERIVKASRDMTAASKKIIFALQRVRTLGEPLPAAITAATEPHYAAVSTSLAQVAPELAPPNAHRYARSLSGLQELVEALAFAAYLETQRVAPLAALQARIDALAGGARVPLSADDYVQGVLDLTGEMMRFAVTGMAARGAVPAGPQGRSVLADLQDLRGALEGADARAGGPRAWRSKMEVLRASVDKVERGAYGLAVRGGERPRGWMPELDGPAGARGEVEGF